MIFNVSGGGGAALNFKVLAYATEEELLASTPVENTIGIITDTPITSWAFCATQPLLPSDGMVWIATGTDSVVEFNALKKNNVEVYPLYAKQCVSGIWVEKTAKSYQNGWVNWVYELYLYSYGTISDAAGSLVQTGVKYNSCTAGSCTLTQGASNVTIGTLSGKGALVYFNNKIDLTPFKNLYFNGSVVDKKSSSSYENCGIGVWKSIPTDDASTEASAIMEGFRADAIHELNIASCTGEHYVGIVVAGFGDAASPYLLTTMKQLWLK